jgi:shikimate kinase
MGSGKSYQARMWSGAFNIPCFDLDKLIMDHTGHRIPDIFAMYGESFFRQKEMEILRSMNELPQALVACGGGTPCFFDNMKWMNENGITIYLRTTREVIFERLQKNKDKRPLIAGMSDLELKYFIKNKLEEREPFYMQAKWVVDMESSGNEWFSKNILQNIHE